MSESAQRMSGRFAAGNTEGKNSAAIAANNLRERLFKIVTPDRFAAAWEALLEKAEAGDINALREMNSRVLGKPLEFDLLGRLEEIEEKLSAHEDGG